MLFRSAYNGPSRNERVNQRAAGVIPHARAPRRLGHIVIGSPDIDSTIRFLVEGFGFKVSDQFPGIIAFLRCSTDHHNVAVVNSEVPQLQHYSWECDDIDHVGHNATTLIRADPSRQGWGFGRHYVGSNFFWYLLEPSGSFIEFYSDLDIITDDIEWDVPGAFTLQGKAAFDREIENEGFIGRPVITVTRQTEGDEIVIAEGTVRTQQANGNWVFLRFVDVFEMQAWKIRRLTSYLVNVPDEG